jgi:hypothetical protein
MLRKLAIVLLTAGSVSALAPAARACPDSAYEPTPGTYREYSPLWGWQYATPSQNVYVVPEPRFVVRRYPYSWRARRAIRYTPYDGRWSPYRWRW